MGIENPVHLLFIAVIALVVLGPRRLPELTRAVGKGIREFREAIGDRQAVEPDEPGAPHSRLAEEPIGLEPAPAHEEPAGHRPVAAAGEPSAADQVDPAQAIRSGDAPDRRPL
jgi:TatA/E family protein of Tat protein translocase